MSLVSYVHVQIRKLMEIKFISRGIKRLFEVIFDNLFEEVI